MSVTDQGAEKNVNMLGNRRAEAPAGEEKVVTVLSIDGGGVRSIIQAAVLEKLERILRKLDGDDVRIADYFDVIAGSNTGSTIAAMLTAPDEKQPRRPRYAAKEITTFLIEASEATYSDEAKIASQRINKLKEKMHPENFKWYHLCSRLRFLIRQACILVDTQCFRPDFDGKNMKKLINGKLRQPKIENLSSGDDGQGSESHDEVDDKRKMRLDETLKDVIVPVFSLNHCRPFIFTSDKARNHRQQMFGNVNILDVISSSTATPTLFPYHSFRYKGRKSSFVDGNLATQNPTLLALYEAARKHGSQPGYCNYLILSIGSGRPKILPEATFVEGLKWIQFCCLRGITSAMEYAFCTDSDMVELYMTRLLQGNLENYLRIQDYALDMEATIRLTKQDRKASTTTNPVKAKPDQQGISSRDDRCCLKFCLTCSSRHGSSVSEACRSEETCSLMKEKKPSRFESLKKLGKELLSKPATFTNPVTGMPEEKNLSNKAALYEFAKKLSGERKRRLKQENPTVSR